MSGKHVDPFRCSLCGSSFKDIETFSIHLSNHSIEVVDDGESGAKDSERLKGFWDVKDDSETETASEVEMMPDRSEALEDNPRETQGSPRETPPGKPGPGQKGSAPNPYWSRAWTNSGEGRDERRPGVSSTHKKVLAKKRTRDARPSVSQGSIQKQFL